MKRRSKKRSRSDSDELRRNAVFQINERETTLATLHEMQAIDTCNETRLVRVQQMAHIRLEILQLRQQHCGSVL